MIRDIGNISLFTTLFYFGRKKMSNDIKNYIGQNINGFKVLDAKRENNRTYLKIVCPKCGEIKWMLQNAVKRCETCGCGQKDGKKAIDLSGQRFGKLTVIQRVENKGNTVMWECRCDCGNTITVPSQSLRNGITISCGCEKRRTKDYTGQRFGRLILLEKTNYTEKGGYVYKCKCDCGNIIYRPISLIKSGGIKSCGCLPRDLGKEKIKRMREINHVEGTAVGNIASRKLAKNNTSGYTGVTKCGKYWQARIKFKGIIYYLGNYKNKEMAIRARQEAEKELYGTFLEWYAENFPEQWKRIQKKNSSGE